MTGGGLLCYAGRAARAGSEHLQSLKFCNLEEDPSLLGRALSWLEALLQALANLRHYSKKALARCK